MKGQARELARALDGRLSAEGFRRKGLTWNRRSQLLVDIIDLQVTKAADAVYVNLGVADPSVFVVLWERPLPDFVQEPNATVRTRLGPLFGEVDVSWRLDDIRTSTEIANRLSSHGLPFLAAMREPGRRAEFLRDRPGLLPIEQLNVALARIHR